MVIVILDKEIIKQIETCSDCGKIDNHKFMNHMKIRISGIIVEKWFCNECIEECNDCEKIISKTYSYYCEGDCGIWWCEVCAEAYESDNYRCGSCC